MLITNINIIMKIFKDTNEIWVMGDMSNPPSCNFRITEDDSWVISSNYNDEIFFRGEITDIQFKDSNGVFVNCSGEADFRAKAMTIDFLSSIGFNYGIATY